jgi:hypothetical protein
MVLWREVIEIGKATDTIVGVGHQHLRGLGNITLAVVALDFIRGVHDVLNDRRIT